MVTNASEVTGEGVGLSLVRQQVVSICGRTHLSIYRLFPLDKPLCSFAMFVEAEHLDVAFCQHGFFQVIDWSLPVSLSIS
jgi:hypothetical protein